MKRTVRGPSIIHTKAAGVKFGFVFDAVRQSHIGDYRLGGVCVIDGRKSLSTLRY